jgi:hypothetical protein
MDDNRQFKPLEYRCPICGEKTTFGTHFCKGEKTEKRLRFGSLPVKRIAVSILALLLATALLWDMVGVFSLYFLAAVFLLALLFLAVRRSPIGRSVSAYRELVKLAGGDKEAVERLISLDRIKRPNETRRKHIESVLREWRRDLR